MKYKEKYENIKIISYFIGIIYYLAINSYFFSFLIKNGLNFNSGKEAILFF